LYINHAFIKCTELVPELERAVNFLKKSPKEVVVLNFHQFPYPSDFLISHHLEVLDVIATIFGELIYPLPRLMHKRGPKLKEFWQSGKRSDRQLPQRGRSQRYSRSFASSSEMFNSCI
jgi:hypothetical protein